MPDDALAVLRDAIHQAWRGGTRTVVNQRLVELAGGEVDRPAALRDVLNLLDGEQSRAVVGLVALDHSTIDADGFSAARDTLRRTAHYLTLHLNPPSLADDAQLWAVAPAGTEGNEAWMRLRAEVHQDSWSLPKSVWLPSAALDPSAFLREGPLARPWDALTEAAGGQLDLHARFARKLGTRQAAWQRERVDALLAALTATDGAGTDPEAVATRLMQLAEEA
jgi:hypothetical protein